jgi:ketosteroid isomerase-like protein
VSTAERLDALVSVQQLRDLPSRYAAAYARLDLDELVRLYAPDVELLDGRRGRQALRDHFERGMRGTGVAGLHTVILHTGDHLIDFTGTDSGTGTDTAQGSVYCLGEMQRTDGSWYRQTIIYTDAYARVDGTWYFARQRRHELVYGTPPLTRPNRLPPANWPASQTGRGTLPDRWPSWQRFWGADA